MYVEQSVLLTQPKAISRSRGEPNIIVPVASGFDEDRIVFCVSKLRSQGIRVWLASESGQSVRSRYGLTIQVDKRMRDFRGLHSASKVLLTGGPRSLHKVLSSEDMRSLLAQLASAGGEVITTRDADEAVEASGLIRSLQHVTWRSQDWECLPEFITHVGVM